MTCDLIVFQAGGRYLHSEKTILVLLKVFYLEVLLFAFSMYDMRGCC